MNMNKLLLPLILRAPVAVRLKTIGRQTHGSVRRFAKQAKQSPALTQVNHVMHSSLKFIVSCLFTRWSCLLIT